MDSNTQARDLARAKTIKTMAHPTRLFIVDELSKNGEKYVCNPTEIIA